MSTDDFIIALFCRIDRVLGHVPRHDQAKLHPSELVTLACLFALKGVGTRAFYRWLSRNYRPWFPSLPERTRLFRLFAAHQAPYARTTTRLQQQQQSVAFAAGGEGGARLAQHLALPSVPTPSFA